MFVGLLPASFQNNPHAKKPVSNHVVDYFFASWWLVTSSKQASFYKIYTVEDPCIYRMHDYSLGKTWFFEYCELLRKYIYVKFLVELVYLNHIIVGKALCKDLLCSQHGGQISDLKRNP